MTDERPAEPARSSARRSAPRRLWFRVRPALVAVTLTAVVAVAALEAVPVSWLKAEPVGDPASVDTAVILGFGFERADDGTMLPGLTNTFLLDWTLREFPHVTTLFVQEGVWTAACPQAERSCQVGRVTLHRIDRHDDRVDLHTNALATCTIERMLSFGKRRAILVAQPIQLGRATRDFAAASKRLCEDCELVVPAVPDAPYDPASAQWRTRSSWFYKPIDVVAYTLDRTPLGTEPPGSCPMPMPPGE